MSIKSKLYCCLSICIPFAITLFYVWSTAADVAFRDDMYLIKGGFVEKYCDGSLAFGDLWRPTALNRILGYGAIQWVNMKIFGMNSRIIVLLIPFLILASAILIYRDYRKSLLPRCSMEFITASFFLLSLVIFSVIQWEGLTYAYGFVFQAPMPFFIASFISLELFVTRSDLKYWFPAFVFPTLAILVFGGNLAFVFAPSLGSTFLCYLLIHHFKLSKDCWFRLLLISIFLIAIACLYLYRIHENDYFSSSSGLLDKIMIIMISPTNALQFLLAALGASVVGVNVADMYLSFQFMATLGMFVLFLYGLSMYLFVASKLYKITYLPLYLIMQSFFYIVFMMIGRFGHGIDYGMASRYTCISIYGLVGSLWMIIFFLVNSNNIKPYKRILLYLPAVVIFSGILVTSIVEWRIQPHRQAYFKKLHEIALRVDTATDEELSKFEERPALVRGSLKILRDCNLNVYRSSSPHDLSH